MKADEICHVATTSFHNELGSEQYPIEADRYWLYTSKLCPFAHRTEITRALKGLDKLIGHTATGAVQTEKGWDIGGRYLGMGSAESPMVGVNRLPEIYHLSSPSYSGRYSVPVLFDTKTKTIVNNESAQIIEQFDKLATDVSTENEFYPELLRAEIDTWIKRFNSEFITPLYQAGFASSQVLYQSNFDSVFRFLEALEGILEDDQSSLIPNQITLADVHAFPHLARFDSAYHSLYRLNKKFIGEYPKITQYLGNLARNKGFGDTLDINEVKDGYFLSWNQPTEGKFVPIGPEVDPDTGVLTTR